jgi:hypothetical protein
VLRNLAYRRQRLGCTFVAAIIARGQDASAIEAIV